MDLDEAFAPKVIKNNLLSISDYRMHARQVQSKRKESQMKEFYDVMKI